MLLCAHGEIYFILYFLGRGQDQDGGDQWGGKGDTYNTFNNNGLLKTKKETHTHTETETKHTSLQTHKGKEIVRHFKHPGVNTGNKNNTNTLL